LAALLDATENAALIVMLWGTLVEPLPSIARWCATGKFTLIAVGLVYAAAMLWLTLL
jgi:hypothetical protein